ncbi:zinc finger MYM-type protein 1-like [Rhopilema esculentum]|uniref:zinc finger MYM-type protein 1-like n=1 Tax=Rhopilema esculentum TaxID=499914 RepID=UPI0031DEE194|eukprot:gene11209-21377_t
MSPVWESQREKAWTQTGVNDWKHLSDKVKRHIRCGSHVENCLKLAFFGQTNIADQLSQAYRESILQHNLEVEKNRHILSRIIDCIKFCCAFELALRGHDETSSSDNPGVFLGLVNFTAALDSVLSQHLETANIFRGTSKTIQNELLKIMYKIMQSKIQKEIKEADFVAVIADDTTDVSNHLQNVVVFRYITSGKIVERFWTFCDMPQGDAATISSNVLSCLDNILPGTHEKQKLVAQCYDGASVMSGQHRGVQSIVKDAYPNAHYVHCYAHQLNLVLQQAVSHITGVRVFFANLNAFSVFFSRSPKRVSCLDECVARRIPRSVQTRWNFQSRIVSTVFEHKDDLIKCFEMIINTWKRDQVSVREASGLLHWLQDRNFLIYLEFFQQLMPHVDILYAQLQKRQISATFIQTCIQNFVKAINNVRDKVPDICSMTSSAESVDPLPKRPRFPYSDEELSVTLIEVSDVIISHCCSRFKFTEHLTAATLFESGSFS